MVWWSVVGVGLLRMVLLKGGSGGGGGGGDGVGVGVGAGGGVFVRMVQGYPCQARTTEGW